jgi:hypothetical protein
MTNTEIQTMISGQTQDHRQSHSNFDIIYRLTSVLIEIDQGRNKEKERLKQISLIEI